MDFLLARTPAFKSLPEAVLAELSAKLIPLAYAKGAEIFSEGDRAEAVFLLRAGLLKAVKYSPSSGPSSMEIIAPGELFGMIAVLDDKPYPVSAVALKASEAYRIPAKLFLSLMDEHSAFSKQVYASIGGHLRQAQALRALTTQPVDRRIAHVLLLLADSLGGEIGLRREEIAQLAGCTPETAIRTLTAFRKKGWISSGWKRIAVLKPAALKRLTS